MRGALKQLQVAQSIVCLYSNLVNPNNPKLQGLLSARSTANQAPLPLVDQDIGDDRRFRRFRLSTCFMIPGLQFLKFFPARWVSEQRPQFRLPLLESFRRRHKFSLQMIWDGAFSEHVQRRCLNKPPFPTKPGWEGRGSLIAFAASKTISMMTPSVCPVAAV